LSILSPIKPPPLPGKSRSSRTLLLLLAIGLLIPAAFIVWRIGISWKVHSRLSALRRAGYPSSMAELQQIYYSPIPDKENNALFFTAALKNLKSTNGFKSSVPFWIGPSGYTLADDSVLHSADGSNSIKAFLSQNAGVWKNVREKPPGENARYPLDFSNHLANAKFHLIKAQDGVRLLLLSALSNGEAGNTDVATTDLNAALRLTQSLGNEPIVMSQMVHIKCDLMIVPCLERILRAKPLKEAQLSSLAKSFQHTEIPDAMERAMAGEECFGIWLFSQAMHPASNSSRRELYIIMKLTGYMDADFNEYLKLMEEEIATGRMPLPQRLDAAKNLDMTVGAVSPKLHLLTSIMIPNYYQAQLAQADDVARIHLTLVAIALERYRLAHNDQLPDMLQELVPVYLPAVPADPFDGKPVHYQMLSKGYLIYSIGEDGVDNGGSEWNTERKTGDITFSVEH
jgi:hypothetical protein